MQPPITLRRVVTLLLCLTFNAASGISHAQSGPSIQDEQPGLDNQPAPATQLHPVSPVNPAPLVAAETTFAFDLMNELAQAQPDANIFISPYSVASVLQMVGVGAAGQTRTQMQQVLQTTDLSTNVLYPASLDLDKQFASRTNVTLTLANSLWFQQGLRLEPGFRSINQDYFQAKLAAVNFDTSRTAQTINDWADQATMGRINDIVSYPFPPLTRLILANAIYFKGQWTTPFDTNATQALDFYPANGQLELTPMMTREASFAYQENAEFQAVQLPYKGGLQMELFLPGTNSNPQTLLDTIVGGNVWTTIQNNFGPQPGTLTLPKFSLDYKVTLNDALEALGMPDAFGSSANFSGIAGGPLTLSSVQQNSYVAVDETGTEAAAATTITVTTTVTGLSTNDFTMILNRPFFFVITDVNTGSILFMGIVNHPAGND